MLPASANLTSRSHPPTSYTVRDATTRRFRLTERRYPPNMRVPQHAHVKTYLIITLDGTYASTFDTRTEEFRPWTVSFHTAGISHTSLYSAEGAKVLYVELPPEELNRIAADSASHLVTFATHSGSAGQKARQIFNEFSDPDLLSSLALDGLVMQLLAVLRRQLEETPTCLPGWLGRADEFIRARFTEPLHLAGIAKAVGVHPVHLAREYRRFYRCTVGEHIRRLRIEFSCEQLSMTDRALSVIALESGFSDQSHFTEAFKRAIGTVPSHYRRATRLAEMRPSWPPAAGRSVRQGLPLTAPERLPTKLGTSATKQATAL